MFVNTQAVQIDENTYPLAVACLGSSITAEPIDDILGQYLVINQPGASYGQPRRYGYQNNLPVTLVNLLVAKDDFETRYKFVGAGAPPKEKKLRSVKMIKLSEPVPMNHRRGRGLDRYEDVDQDAQPED